MINCGLLRATLTPFPRGKGHDKSSKSQEKSCRIIRIILVKYPDAYESIGGCYNNTRSPPGFGTKKTYYIWILHWFSEVSSEHLRSDHDIYKSRFFLVPAARVGLIFTYKHCDFSCACGDFGGYLFSIPW